jgi:hypothetical protein
MKLLDLLKAVVVNKNNILRNYGNHAIYINLPDGINYIKLIDDVLQGNSESIKNIIAEYEITLSELLTIRNNSLYLGSIYLIAEKLREVGGANTNSDYENVVRGIIREYAGLLNE